MSGSYYRGTAEAEDAMAVIARWVSGNRKIRVVYHDGSAVDADVEKGIIRVPRMACASGVTEEALMLLRGRVYHESGHVDESAAVRKADYPKGAMFSIWNALEDRRMEHAEADKHPGARIVFKYNTEYYNRDIAGKISRGEVNAPLWEAMCALSFLVEGMSPMWVPQGKAKAYADAARDEFMKVLRCSDAKETLELAKVIYALLKDVNEELNKEQPPQQGQSPEQGQEGEESEQGGKKSKKSGKSGKSGKSEKDQDDKPQSSGAGDMDDEGEEDSEDGEDEEEGGEKKDGKDSEDGEDGGKKDSEDGEKDGEDGEKGSEDGEGEEEGDGKKGSEDGEDGEGDGKKDSEDGEGDGKKDSEDGEGDGKKDSEDGEDGEKKDGEGDGDGDGEEDGDGEKGSEGGEKDGEGGEGGEGEGEGDGDGDGKPSDKSFKAEPNGDLRPGDSRYEAKDDEPSGGKGDGRTLEEEAAGVTQEDVINEKLDELFKDMDPADLDYLSRRDLDRHAHPMTDEGHKTQFKMERDEISVAVASMTQALEQALRSLTRCRRKPYLRKGRIDHKRLVAIAKGLSKEVFYRKQDGIDLDVAVAITVDESGSMTNYADVRRLAIAIGEALQAIGVPFSMVGSTTMFGGGDRRMPEIDGFSRVNPILYKHYKDFAEAWPVVRHRVVESGCHLHNVDGEVVEYAAFTLAQRKERRKIVFSLSDGEPCAGHGNDGEMARNLKRVCGRVRKQGVEVYGFGVGTEGPRGLYGSRYFVHLEATDKMGPDFVRKFADVVTGGLVKV